jgi:hypothetical protein
MSTPQKERPVASSKQTGISPFAPFEMQRAADRAKGLILLVNLVRSGISPGPEDPKAWYDRAIRAIGGTMILLAFAFGAIVLIFDQSR